MAFGHASKPTRKYTFGVREFLPRPVRVGPLRSSGPSVGRVRFDGHDAATRQMFLAHQFQNRLVELERARRAATESTVEVLCPNVAELRGAAEAEQAVFDGLRADLRASNSAERKTRSDSTLDTRVEEQLGAAQGAWAEYRAARRAAFAKPSVRTALALVNESGARATKLARGEAVAGGLYWATSLQIAQRVKRTGPEPRFKRYEGEGTISIQFQRKPDTSSERVPVLDGDGEPRIHPRSKKPITAHAKGSSLLTCDLFRQNYLCWVERAAPTVPYRPETDPSRAHVTVHFRVGSDAAGEPIWAHLPTTLHRDLPDGEVKWAHLSRRRVGTHFKWDVMFDIARDSWDEHPCGGERATDGTVAVALGWRVIDGRVRAAEWVGSDGVTGSVLVPDDLVRQWRALEGLQSVRDRLFDQWKAGVREFLLTRTDLTEGWLTRTATIAQWNSPRRLAALVLWWRDNRLPGDDEAFRAAEGELVRNRPQARDTYTGGRKQDKHICDWQAALRARLIAWRKDNYRLIAIGLAYQYKTVVIGEIDWHEIAENPEPESPEVRVNKTHRAISACASLRDQLTHYMAEETVSAVHVTDTCSGCGRCVKHPERGRWIRCERCGGERVDRAVNAAKNLLSRHLGVGAAI